jgi:hypothetical protein
MCPTPPTNRRRRHSPAMRLETRQTLYGMCSIYIIFLWNNFKIYLNFKKYKLNNTYKSFAR